VNVDKEMANILADNIGVKRPTGTNVNVSDSSPALSMANTTYSPYTQKIAVLIGNGFKAREVKSTLNTLENAGIFIDIVSEKLGYITGDDGTRLKVTGTFTTKNPVLYDSIYVVGGKSEDQSKFNHDIMMFYGSSY